MKNKVQKSQKKMPVMKKDNFRILFPEFIGDSL